MPVKIRTSEDLRDYLGNIKVWGNAYKRDPDSLYNTIQDYIANSDEVTEQAEQLAHTQVIKMAREGTLGAQNTLPIHDNDTGKRTNRLRAAMSKGHPNKYNSRAVGAKLDATNEFRDASVGEIMAAIVKHSDGTANVEQRKMISKMLEIQNSLGSVIPSDGGFLIPEQTRADILTLALEESIVRSRATVFPMSSLTLGIPTVDDTSHVTNVFGGISFSFTPESGTIAASQPRFGKVMLEAGKLAFFTNIPNELMDDAPALTVWLNARLPQAHAWYEDYYFLRGSGAGEPEGVFNAPARISVDRQGSGTDTFVWDDAVNMFSRMLPRSLDKAVWIASNEMIPSLLNLQLLIKEASANVGGSYYYSGGGRPTELMGRPIIYTEHASQLGTEGDISFVDFGEYLVGDRMSWQMKTSTDYRFQNDETSIRGISRVDGRPWLPTAITPANGGDTLSPYVTLAN